MNPRPSRLPRALAASALALVLPLAACAGTDAEAGGDGVPASASSAARTSDGGTAEGAGTPTPPPAEPGQRIEVQVSGGQVTGDTGRVAVPVGEEVTLVLTSDVADEAHVHGYDLTADLAPGTPAEISFTATIPGVFEVELHDAGTVLFTMQVS